MKGVQTFDPARHCGAHIRPASIDRRGLPPCTVEDKAKCPNPGHKCTQRAGFRTEHHGAGRCWEHGGRTPNGIIQGTRELARKAVLDSLAALTLTQIAERLARHAAALALVDPDDADGFSRAVNAFARAAERAEGNKLDVTGRLEFLAHVPDRELEAALAEVGRLLETSRT